MPPTPSQIRFAVDPRMVPAHKAARRLHLLPSEFEKLLPRLLQRGFPRPDPDIGHFDLKAIDEWLDRQSVSLQAPGPIDARTVMAERLAYIAEHGVPGLKKRARKQDANKLP